MKDRAAALFQAAVREHQEVVAKLGAMEPIFTAAAEAMTQALRGGNKLLFCGNGGSAADAQHLAAEFTGRFLLERSALPAIALHCNTSSLTAIGNDYGYDRVYAREVQAFGRPGDMLIGLSTSGNSKNVIQGMIEARGRGLKLIGFTGASGGEMKALCDWCFCVPSTSTPRIQEAHILIGHCLCEMVEKEIASAERGVVHRNGKSNGVHQAKVGSAAAS